MVYTLIVCTSLCSEHVVARHCLSNTSRFISYLAAVVMIRLGDLMTLEAWLFLSVLLFSIA